MHEVNKEEDTLAALLTQLTNLVELNMAIMVQLTKIYDVTVFNAVTQNAHDGQNLEGLKGVLDGHEGGFMATSEPLLRAFAAPDANNNPPTYDPKVDDSAD